jgi:hypothetical protein
MEPSGNATEEEKAMTTSSTTAAEPGEPTLSEPALSEPARREYTAELDKLDVAKTSGPRDRAVSVLGIVLAVVGLAVTVLCYSQAVGFDDLRDQVQVGILALFGVGLVVLGTGLYATTALTRFLRLWLLRLVHEQRDRAAR